MRPMRWQVVGSIIVQLALVSCAGQTSVVQGGDSSAPAASPTSTAAPAPAAEILTPHRRSVAFAQNGMVAAEHPHAARVGIEILQQGGNAIDAAIATNAVLGFLQPNANGVGGDLFAVVWSARDQKLYGLNASGRAPAGLTIDKVKPLADGTIDPRSPASWSADGPCP